MAMLSLGQLGEPRESDLADLSKYTGELRKEYVVSREKALDRSAEQANIYTKAMLESQQAKTKRTFDAAESHKQRVMDAKKIVIKDKLDQAEATRKNLRDTLTNYWDKPEDQRKLFDSSDQGKQWQKLIKEHLPEAFDENGQLVPLPSKKSEGGYKPQTQEEAIAFKVNSESALRKLKSNSPLTPQEAAAVGQFATNAMTMGLMPQEQAEKLVQLSSKYLQQNQFTNQLAGGGGGAEGGDVDPQDRLGLLK